MISYMLVMISESLSLKIKELLRISKAGKPPTFRKIAPVSPFDIFSIFFSEFHWPRVQRIIPKRFVTLGLAVSAFKSGKFWKCAPPPPRNQPKFQKTGDGTMFRIRC